MLLGAPFDCGDKTREKSILWALDDSKISHAQDWDQDWPPLLIESVDLFCLFTNHISEKDLLNRDLARLDKSKQCLENAQWVINFDDKRQNILKQNGHLGGKKLIYKYIFFRRCYLVTFNEQKNSFIF